MNEREVALLGVIVSMIGFMQSEGVVNRERLIDYLLEVMAAEPRDTSSPLHEMLQSVVRMLEHTQFPQE